MVQLSVAVNSYRTQQTLHFLHFLPNRTTENEIVKCSKLKRQQGQQASGLPTRAWTMGQTMVNAVGMFITRDDAGRRFFFSFVVTN